MSAEPKESESEPRLTLEQVQDAFKQLGYRRRDAEPREVVFAKYEGPEYMFLGGIPVLVRVGVSLWSVLMQAVRFEHVPFIDNDATLTDKMTVMNFPGLDNEPLFYPVAARMLVDEDALKTRYATATDGRVSTDVLPAHKTLRVQTDEMRMRFKQLHQNTRLMLTFAADPVVVASMIILGVMRVAPSSDDKYNAAIGCIAADLVLAAHNCRLIPPRLWTASSFVDMARTCASHPDTTNDLCAIRTQEFSAELRAILSQQGRACDACGLTLSANKEMSVGNSDAVQSLRACAKCHLAYYCTEACRKSDERHHQGFCADNAVTPFPDATSGPS